MLGHDSATGPILDHDMIVPENALNILTYPHRIQQRGMNVTTRNGIANPCQNIVAVFIQRQKGKVTVHQRMLIKLSQIS